MIICEKCPAHIKTRPLSTKERLALIAGTSLVPASVLSMPDKDIDVDWMIKHGIRPIGIRAANMEPKHLYERGGIVDDYKTLGYDAIHLCNVKWCHACLALFGCDHLKRVFLANAMDAIVLADAPTTFDLNIEPSDLIGLCAGQPIEATAVIKQMKSLQAPCQTRATTHARPHTRPHARPHTVTAQGLSASELLDTGLRSKTLVELGWTDERLKAELNATNEEMQKLGFSATKYRVSSR